MSKGVQYYRQDTNRYWDIRIRKLRKEYGTDGIAVYDYLLARVYGIMGCYAMCDEDCLYSVSEYFDMKESTVREIIGYCASMGLFNQALLMRYGVITSKSIQRSFVDMCKNTKRKYICIPLEYLLLPVEEIGLLIKQPKNSVENEKTPEEMVKTPEEMVKTPEEIAMESTEKNSGGNSKNSRGNGKNSGVNSKNSRGNGKNSGENEKTPEGSEEERKEKNEKNNKEEDYFIIEPSTKAEDSMSDFQESTDASSAASPSLFGDEVLEEKTDRFSHEELIKFWNTVTGGVYGKLICIDNNRLTMTLARIREHGKDAFCQAIRNAAASEYLKTVAWFSYDWMVRPNNFVKVLEDKYGKKERTDSAGGSGQEMSEMDAANSIPMGGGEGRNVKPVRKRVYD